MLATSIQAEQLGERIGIQTDCGRTAWIEGISNWPRTTKDLATRAAVFAALKRRSAEFPTSAEFSRIAELEHVVAPLLRAETDVEKESYEQVCWRGNPWSQLNSLPFALVILAFYKSWCLPILTICMPIFLVIASYILMAQMMPGLGERLSLLQFLKLVWGMWMGGTMGGGSSGIPGLPIAQETSDAMSSIKKLAQFGSIAFTVGQSLWTPIQQARHFRKLDVDCTRIGAAIVELEQKGIEWCRSWRGWWPRWSEKWLASSESDGDARRAFAFAIETPFWLKHVLRCFGRFETLICLARSEETSAIQVLSGPAPQFFHTALYDPSIGAARAVKSSISLGHSGAAQHAVVTGPNRGGKSSSLRAALTAVVLGHTYGAAFTDGLRGRAAMTRFSWIGDGLRLEDSPGKTSMFEREVAFAKTCLDSHAGYGFIVYDECFHSTNPTDSERTSTLFCSRLWRDTRCLSILSTHLYSLAEKAPSAEVQKLCVPAKRLPAAQFQFSYKLSPGICKVSSVDGLLDSYGFFAKSPRNLESKENPPVKKNEYIE
jgi:hypothetical protein